MPVTEAKRRGRPPKVQETDDAADDPIAEPEAPRVDPNAPPCPRCGDPLETSRTLLRAYGMTCHRCRHCRHVAIENDNHWYDLATAVSGDPPLIVERAAALYAAKNARSSPDGWVGGAEDAILSDERWTPLT